MLGSSTGDADELSAAAAWLYKATGEAGYLNEAKSFYPAGTAWGFAWNDANVGAAVRSHPYHIYILLYFDLSTSFATFFIEHLLNLYVFNFSYHYYLLKGHRKILKVNYVFVFLTKSNMYCNGLRSSLTTKL